MIHEVYGNNFHGDYHLRLRGPAEGFRLWPAQVRRYWDTLCGLADCKCGGGYGTGPGEGSARIAVGLPDLQGSEPVFLIPASSPDPQRTARLMREAGLREEASLYLEAQAEAGEAA